MSNVRLLEISAVRDGATTFIVFIEEPATGAKQVIEGVVANSEEDAIDRVAVAIERNIRAALN